MREETDLRAAEAHVVELAAEATRLAEQADRAAARAQLLRIRALTRDRGVLEQLVDLVVPGDAEHDRLVAADGDHRRAEDAAGHVATSLAGARDQVVDAEAAWSTTHARLSRLGGRIGAYAAARAAIARAQAGVPRASRSPGQVARDQGALARWRRYLLDLAEAGVVPPPAADLADPGTLAGPLEALRDAEDAVVPGVAAVRRGPARGLPVLPAETVRAVSAAFGRVGAPAGPGGATARCGGLVRQAWAGAGIAVPAVAASQWRGLEPVPRRSAQVGDVAYLGAPGVAPVEAGIHLGDGLMIGADPVSGVLRVGPLPLDRVRGFRRVTLPRADRRTDEKGVRGIAAGCGPIGTAGQTPFRSFFLGLDTAGALGMALPPGHGGTPPGHGGIPPGHGGTIPGAPLVDVPGYLPPPLPDPPAVPGPRPPAPTPQPDDRPTPAPNSDADFRVVSFNVLGHSHTRPGGHKTGWADSRTRMRTTTALLERYGVDLVGFQELQTPQARDFRAMTGGRWSTYSAPGNPVNAVAWRKDRFQLVSGRTVPIPYFRGRMQPMPVVRLRAVASGKEFYLGNFHNPATNRRHPGNEKWRDEATRRQVKLVATLRATGLPVLVTGDMNEREEYFCAMTSAGTMRAAAGGSYVGGRCRPPANPAVDWIFGSTDVSFGRYVKDRSRLVAVASDHPLVVADVRLPR